MSNSKILVTPRSVTKSGHPLLDKLTGAGFDVVLSTPGIQPNENELLQRLPGCVGYLAGVEKVSAMVLETADSLKVISRNGAGVNNVDLKAAHRLGIKVLNAPGANARGVAELALAHILNLARSVSFSDAILKSRNWERQKGVELQDKTLGLVGCGNIGKKLVTFALAMDMNVLAFDPFKDESFKPSSRFCYCELDKLFTHSDFISLHCPASDKPLIDETQIAKMKDGVYLINTARAELFDEDAVKRSLKSGKIAGISIDAFESEPPQNWSLVENPHALATPHIGGFTQESVHRAMKMAIDNLINELS